jgi:hypothetical protein
MLVCRAIGLSRGDYGASLGTIGPTKTEVCAAIIGVPFATSGNNIRTIISAVPAPGAPEIPTSLQSISVTDRWTVRPPEPVVLSQLTFELFYAVLLVFVSRGEYAARLIYAVALGVRTMNVIGHTPDDWHSSHALVLVTVISLACQYLAMYWVFTEPGRRWFGRQLP